MRYVLFVLLVGLAGCGPGRITVYKVGDCLGKIDELAAKDPWLWDYLDGPDIQKITEVGQESYRTVYVSGKRKGQDFYARFPATHGLGQIFEQVQCPKGSSLGAAWTGY